MSRTDHKAGDARVRAELKTKSSKASTSKSHCDRAEVGGPEEPKDKGKKKKTGHRKDTSTKADRSRSSHKNGDATKIDKQHQALQDEVCS